MALLIEKLTSKDNQKNQGILKRSIFTQTNDDIIQLSEAVTAKEKSHVVVSRLPHGYSENQFAHYVKEKLRSSASHASLC